GVGVMDGDGHATQRVADETGSAHRGERVEARGGPAAAEDGALADEDAEPQLGFGEPRVGRGHGVAEELRQIAETTSGTGDAPDEPPPPLAGFGDGGARGVA